MSNISVGGSGWTAELPAGWRAPDANRPNYFESSDGTAGAYFTHYRSRRGDLRASLQRAHAIVKASPPSGEDWQIVRQHESIADTHGECAVDYYSASDRYLICTRIVGRGVHFVRMSFHDYDCEHPERSAQRAHGWLSTLTLHTADE